MGFWVILSHWLLVYKEIMYIYCMGVQSWLHSRLQARILGAVSPT